MKLKSQIGNFRFQRLLPTRIECRKPGWVQPGFLLFGWSGFCSITIRQSAIFIRNALPNPVGKFVETIGRQPIWRVTGLVADVASKSHNQPDFAQRAIAAIRLVTILIWDQQADACFSRNLIEHPENVRAVAILHASLDSTPNRQGIAL